MESYQVKLRAGGCLRFDVGLLEGGCGRGERRSPLARWEGEREGEGLAPPRLLAVFELKVELMIFLLCKYEFLLFLAVSVQNIDSFGFLMSRKQHRWFPIVFYRFGEN